MLPLLAAAAASKGSIGCDFLVPTPKVGGAGGQPCYALFVANGWTADAPIQISRGGITYDPSLFGRIAETGTLETAWKPVPATGVPVGQVAVLFLSDSPGPVAYQCPVLPALRDAYGSLVAPNPGDSAASGTTGRGNAWHITAGLPVTSVDLMPYVAMAQGWVGSTAGASLLWPTTAWGTNYLALSPGLQGAPGPNGNYLSQTALLVASKDSTTVSVVPSESMPASPTVGAAVAGLPSTYTLNAGEYIQWESGIGFVGAPDTTDWSGTVFLASGPVSFVGGASYWPAFSSTYPNASRGAPHKQSSPVSALGSEYAVAPYASREATLADESIPYRLLSIVDGTNVTFDPPVAVAPSALAAGQVADFQAVGAFVVSSQDDKHPFAIAQIMAGNDSHQGDMLPYPAPRAGCTAAEIASYFTPPQDAGALDGGYQCGVGGAEFVNVVPPPEFLSRYVFFADPGFPTSNLVFVRRNVGQGFQDVTLDCAGVIGGWKAVGSSGKYEQTNVDLVRAKMPNGKCNNGPHTASSAAPFSITVWGLDLESAYAYPAGANFSPINTVVVTQ
jgi:hypothetical protein